MNPNDNSGNPYSAPKAAVVSRVEAVAPEGDERLRNEPATMPAGAGSRWVGEGWELFKRDPWLLVGAFVVYFVVAMLIQAVPVLGDIAAMLLSSVWGAGWFILLDKLRRGENPTVSELFSGFQHAQFGSLIAVGGIYLAMIAGTLLIALVAVVVLIGVNDFSDLPNLILGSIATIIAIVFIVLTGLFLAIATIAYAPALIVFHNVPVGRACGMSFQAFMRNWASMTVMGLILTFWMLMTVFTVFIAMVVVTPLMAAAFYMSYRDIFLEQGA